MFYGNRWGGGCVYVMLTHNKGGWTAVQPWQHAAFHSHLRTLLAHIAGHHLNYLEFRLLADQAALRFASPAEEARCRQLFEAGQVGKEELLGSLRLGGTGIAHCRQFYVVRVRRSREETAHQGAKCFEFWKDTMRQKYGYYHQWFELLCQERDIRRVSLQRFLTCVHRVLDGTLHAHCAKTIALVFEKNRKSEIEFSVFMNTILITTKQAMAESLRTQRAASEIMTTSKVSASKRYAKTAKEVGDVGEVGWEETQAGSMVQLSTKSVNGKNSSFRLARQGRKLQMARTCTTFA